MEAEARGCVPGSNHLVAGDTIENVAGRTEGEDPRVVEVVELAIGGATSQQLAGLLHRGNADQRHVEVPRLQRDRAEGDALDVLLGDLQLLAQTAQGDRMWV